MNRPIVKRRRSLRTIARVGGISSSRPTMSVRQQGAADHDQQTVDDLLAGEASLRQRLVEAAPGAAALVFEQEGAEQGVGQEQCQSRPEADRFADLDDHVELRDRDNDEEGYEEKRHPYSLGAWSAGLGIYEPLRRE
jgi:hypothetical protein